MKRSLPNLIILFLLIIHIIPIWTIQYFPSQDGPTHIANAVIRKHYSNPDYEIYRKYYELSTLPVPNWAFQAFSDVALNWVSPLTAEKLFITVYVVLFILAVFLFVEAFSPSSRILGLIGFLFVFHLPVFLGLYNFSIGIPFSFLSIAYWWKHRSNYKVVQALILNILLVIAYFCHIVSVVIALISITSLSILQHRKGICRENALLFLSLIPASILPIYYFAFMGINGPISFTWDLRDMISYLLFAKILVSYGNLEYLISIFVIIFYLFMLYLGVKYKYFLAKGRLREDGLLVLASVFLLLYIIAPNQIGGGGALRMRLPLYIFLFLLPWLAHGLTGLSNKKLFTGLVLTLIAVNLCVKIVYLNRIDKDLKAFTSGLQSIDKNKTVIPLVFGRSSATKRVEPFTWAFNYYCLSSPVVNLMNYEAYEEIFSVNVFSIRWRPGKGLDPSIDRIILESPDRIDVKRYVDRADYFYTWGLPQGSEVEFQLNRYYYPVFETEQVKIFKRHPSAS